MKMKAKIGDFNISKKHIYIGVASVVALVLVIWLVKKLFRKKSSDAGLDMIEKSVQVENLSYDLSQYSVFADEIEGYLSDNGLFGGGLYGVNQKGVYSVIGKMKTDDDVKKLIVAFGTRKFRKQYTFGSKDLTLGQAMGYLLTTGELKEVNEILKENNINYTF